VIRLPVTDGAEEHEPIRVAGQEWHLIGEADPRQPGGDGAELSPDLPGRPPGERSNHGRPGRAEIRPFERRPEPATVRATLAHVALADAGWWLGQRRGAPTSGAPGRPCGLATPRRRERGRTGRGRSCETAPRCLWISIHEVWRYKEWRRGCVPWGCSNSPSRPWR